jgi:hypothetical protein
MMGNKDLKNEIKMELRSSIYSNLQTTKGEKERIQGFKYISAINMLNTYVYAHKTDVSHTHTHTYTQQAL